MQKIEKVDLFECRFHSSEFALLQEQLRTLEQQEQNIRITEALIAERRQAVQQQLQQKEQKLSELGEMLEETYGITDQDQINWETGEIRSAAQTPAGPQNHRLTTSRYVAPRVSSAAVDPAGGAGAETADSTGAAAPDRGGAEDPGPAVE